ncbi:MAG: class I SAM-dependent methyltransferase [Patescibacteria group bacterium]
MVNNEIVKKFNKIFHNEEANFYDQQHLEILREGDNWKNFCQRYLEHLSRPITVLDVGSGTGFVPAILAQYLTPQDKVICADISLKMLMIAKEKLKKFSCQFEFVETDCEEMPFLANTSIDLITVNSVLHHLPGYHKFLEEANRLLKSEGIICIAHEPNRKFFKNFLLVFIFRLLSYFSVKLSKFKKSIQNQKIVLTDEINEQLVKEGIIKSGQKLNDQEIQALVDIWSPTVSSKINKEAGFDPLLIKKEYFPTSKLLLLRTYNHLGKIDSSKNFFLRYLDKLFSNLFPRSGSSFWLIIKKQGL